MIEWLNNERPKYKTAESVYVIEFYGRDDIRVTPCSISSAECHLIYDDKIYFTGRYRMSGWLHDKERNSLRTKVYENEIFKSKELAIEMAKFTKVDVAAGDWLFSVGLDDKKHPNHWFDINSSELPPGHHGVDEIRAMFSNIKENKGIIEFDRLNLEKSLKWLSELSPSRKEQWMSKNSSMGRILKQLNIIL